jgi:hypothetical protein
MIIPIWIIELVDESSTFESSETTKLDRRSTSPSQARTIVLILTIILIFSLILWGYDGGNRKIAAMAGRPHQPLRIPIHVPRVDSAPVKGQENRQRVLQLGQIQANESSCNDSICTQAGELSQFNSDMRLPEQAKVRNK